MRSLVLSLVVVVCAFTASYGQNVLNIGTDSVSITSILGDSAVARIGISHNRPGNVEISWWRITEDFPAASWRSQICDPTQCWIYSLDHQTFDLAAGVTGSIDVHFDPHTVGEGHVQLLINTVADSVGTDTILDYYVTVLPDTVTGIKNAQEKVSLSIYPNPARDYILLKSGGAGSLNRVELFSMLGRKVLTQKLNPAESTSRIELGDLQKGIYMVRVFDTDNNVVLTKSISHVR